MVDYVMSATETLQILNSQNIKNNELQIIRNVQKMKKGHKLIK